MGARGSHKRGHLEARCFCPKVYTAHERSTWHISKDRMRASNKGSITYFVAPSVACSLRTKPDVHICDPHPYIPKVSRYVPSVHHISLSLSSCVYTSSSYQSSSPFTLINEDQTIPSVSYAEEEHDTSNSSHYPARMVSAASAAASPTHQ